MAIGCMSQYLENLILNITLKATGTMPTQGFLALYTTEPGPDGTGGVEVANSFGYARKSTVTGDWTSATTGQMSNAGTITFATASGGSWGTIFAFGVYDSGTYGGGNLLYGGPLTANKTIGDGDTASFAAAALTINPD